MCDVKPIAKFKAKDLVMMLEKTFMPGDDGQEEVRSTVIQTTVTNRLYTTELGWLYELLGYAGYISESVLKPYDESVVKKTLEGDGNGSILEVIVPEELVEARQEQRFKIGDFASRLHQTGEHDFETEYVVIIGCLWDVNSICYDVAYLSAEGKFLDHQDGAFDDELTAVSADEMAEIIQERVKPRVRPKLIVVHSR